MATLVSVSIPNEPGALAKVTTVLAQGGVSVDGATVAPKGGSGEATFLVKDGPKCLKVLEEAGFPGKRVDAYVLTLSNHQGALADICQRLSAAGINIEQLFGTTYGKAGSVAMVTDDNAGAAKILENLSRY